MGERVSMRKAQKERQRKEREQKHTWAREWEWEDIMGFLWHFGDIRLVGNNEEKRSGETESGEVGGLNFEASVYTESLKTAAMKAGLVDGPEWDRKKVLPQHVWLFDEIEEEHHDVRKELKNARTTKARFGAVGVKNETSEELAKRGDITASLSLSKRASTLSKRLGVARTYMRDAAVYIYYLRMHDYNVHDMGPDTLAECYGTKEQNYEDGVLQKQQRKWHHSSIAVTKDPDTLEKEYHYSVRAIQNHMNFAKQFADMLCEKKVFAAYNEDGDLIDVTVLEGGYGSDAAVPDPYRITLDKYLGFPKVIYDGRGRVIKDVNEILLIYNAIQSIKDPGKYGERHPMKKIAKHISLYKILIRVIRESGARPANARWLRWKDFVIVSGKTKKMLDAPYISWVHANKPEHKEPGKKPPKITYISPLLASMIWAYCGYGTSHDRKLDPNEYFIKDEFFQRKTAEPLLPILGKDLAKITTEFLQEIVEYAYKDRPDVIRLLGFAVGAKRFRKSMATLMYGTIKDAQTDEKLIPEIFGDDLTTLAKFYAEESGSINPRVDIAEGAANKYSQVDLANRIFDKELPPGIKRTTLINSCKLKPKKKR